MALAFCSRFVEEKEMGSAASKFIILGLAVAACAGVPTLAGPPAAIDHFEDPALLAFEFEPDVHQLSRVVQYLDLSHLKEPDRHEMLNTVMHKSPVDLNQALTENILPRNVIPRVKGANLLAKQANWKAMSLEDKVALLDFEKDLTPFGKALLVYLYDGKIASRNPEVFAKYFPLKKDAPEWARGLAWDFDIGSGKLGSLEVRSIEPGKNLRAVVNHLKAFASEVGAWDHLTRTGQKGVPLEPLQFHVSLPSFAHNGMVDFLPAYQDLLLAEELAQSPKSIDWLFGLTVVAYKENIESKGLIRVIDPSHIELRFMTKGPEETLNEFFSLASLPSKKANEVLAEKVASLLHSHPEVLDLLKARHPKVAAQLMGYFPFEQKIDRLKSLYSELIRSGHEATVLELVESKEERLAAFEALTELEASHDADLLHTVAQIAIQLHLKHGDVSVDFSEIAHRASQGCLARSLPHIK